MLPPTVPPKRRRTNRWSRSLIAIGVLAIAAVIASSLLNNEVSKRLATVPMPPTTAAPVALTTTTVVAAPANPRSGRGRLGPTTTLPTTTTTSTVVTVPETPSEIISALDKLTVADEHSEEGRTGRFGTWRDDDNDGCDTREEVLLDESTDTVERTRTCRIIKGRWESPYDSAVLTSPIDVAIDHVVTIAEAWRSGAWKWTDQQRNDYVNDLEHPEFLVAVSAAIKDAKGDRDPGDWLPPIESYRCTYLGNWVHLKTVYKMTVDPGEREAIAAAALHC